jgi:hypothetical protein
LQGIAREDGGGLIEGFVARGAAASQIVVVHGRKVVMDQRIGMDHFDRAGRRIQGLKRNAEQFARGVDQRRADALAASQRRVANRLMQSCRNGRRTWQSGVERRFSARLIAGKCRRAVHAQASASSNGSRRAVPSG